MGDGRFRCICGAGEHSSHAEGCVPCQSCKGLGYHFVPSNILYETELTARCIACQGVGRIYVPKENS